jgi:hypothetical protein
MKKTYVTPTVMMTGEVVRETMTANFGSAEPDTELKVAGSIGFNL